MIPTLNDTQVKALYAAQNCFSSLDGVTVELPSQIARWEFDLWVALSLRFPGQPERVKAETHAALLQATLAAA